MARKTISQACFAALAACVAVGIWAGTVSYGSRPILSTLNQPFPSVNTRQTVQHPWQEIRQVDANDTAMTATTKTWALAKAKFLEIPPSWNVVSISAYADGDVNDPNAASFSWSLYACRWLGGAQLVATGTWAIGEMTVGTNPDTSATLTTAGEQYKWAELPVLTASYWPSSVYVSGTSNDIGTITFDPMGCWGVYLQITSRVSMYDVHLHVLATGM